MATRKFISEDNLLYYHAGLKKLFATQSGLTALSNVVNGKADAADTLAGYGITDAMTATQINSAIADAVGDITSFEFQIVQTLPASGEKGTMYLVLMGTTETQNYYEEFIYVNNAWEKLGTLGVDLSGYMKTSDMVEATETEIDTILAS